MLAQVIIDDEHVLALIHEVLANGGAGIGGNVLKRCGVGSGGGDDDGVIHRAVLLQGVHDLGNGGGLLSDGNVNADDAVALLVQHGVHGQSGLTGLTVADDQLTLAAADGEHGVNC